MQEREEVVLPALRVQFDEPDLRHLVSVNYSAHWRPPERWPPAGSAAGPLRPPWPSPDLAQVRFGDLPRIPVDHRQRRRPWGCAASPTRAAAGHRGGTGQGTIRQVGECRTPALAVYLADAAWRRDVQGLPRAEHPRLECRCCPGAQRAEAFEHDRIPPGWPGPGPTAERRSRRARSSSNVGPRGHLADPVARNRTGTFPPALRATSETWRIWIMVAMLAAWGTC